MAVLKSVCFELHCQWIQKIKHICLCDCYHLALQANGTQNSAQSAFQLGVSQKFTVQVAPSAEPKDSVPSIQEADVCYLLSLSDIIKVFPRTTREKHLEFLLFVFVMFFLICHKMACMKIEKVSSDKDKCIQNVIFLQIVTCPVGL